MLSFLRISGATASLCLVAITHTYLLFHCFPYIGYMSLTLPHTEDSDYNVTVDSVGWYAGLLGTAFTTGRCLSFIPWKAIRHKTGVKNTLLLSLLLEAFCSIWFGMSKTYVSAIIARFFLGLSNTLSGCIKRIAINRERAAVAARKETQNGSVAAIDHPLKKKPISQKSEKPQENLALSRVLAFMWWGSALGPVIGGILSNPGAFSENTPILPDELEDQYPFLLPNIVAAALAIFASFAVFAFVEDEEPTTTKAVSGPTPLKTTTSGLGENQPLLVSKQENNDSNPVPSMQRAGVVQVFKIIWKRKNTRLHLLAYWSLSFVVVCIDEALPLFLIARQSGPGLSPLQIGWILSAAGFLVVISQTMALERIMSEEEGLGIYKSLRISAVVGSIPSVLIPLMLVINGGTYQALEESVLATAPPGEGEDDVLLGTIFGESLGSEGYLSWQAFLFLAVLLGCIRIFVAVYFALIGVATGRTVEAGYRDDTARIMTLGALCSRAVAPAVAGYLVYLFMSPNWSFYGDSLALWTVIGLLFGGWAAGYSFKLRAEDTSKRNIVRSERQNQYLHQRRDSGHIFRQLWEAQDSTPAAKMKRMTRNSLAPLVRMSSSGHNLGVDEESGKGGRTSHNKRESWQDHVRHKRRTTWTDHILQPGIDPETVPFFILGTHKNDTAALPHVLTPPLMEALHRYLPMSCCEDNFWLKYSLVRDGASMETLNSRIAMAKNTFLAIETLEGEVFGCFMTKPWEMTNRFEMSGESFLWRLKDKRDLLSADDRNNEEILNEVARKEGEIEVYRWTGMNDECQLLSRDRIAAGSGFMGPGGDGFGLIVQNDLSMGSSSPCATYDNPKLVSSQNGRFEVANLEMWVMTPFLFSSEAEDSDATLRFIEGNMVYAKGDFKNTHAQSAWTNFL